MFNYSIDQRRFFQRLAFGAALLFLIYRYFSGTLLHQLEEPVLLTNYSWTNFFYALPVKTGLLNIIITNSWLALIFDIALIGAATYACIKPQKNIGPIIYFVFIYLYFVAYNTYSLGKTGDMIGLLFIPIPFMVKSQKSFNLLWECLRYYVCIIYSSAFLWKLSRGTIFDEQHATSILLENLSPYLIHNPDSWLSSFYEFFIGNPTLSSTLFGLGVIIQGAYLIGFFTKRFDYWLLTSIIVFHCGTAILVDVFFFEILLLSLTFTRPPINTTLAAK